MSASCTLSIKLSTKNLRCIFTATATENDVTLSPLDVYNHLVIILSWPIKSCTIYVFNTLSLSLSLCFSLSLSLSLSLFLSVSDSLSLSLFLSLSLSLSLYRELARWLCQVVHSDLSPWAQGHTSGLLWQTQIKTRCRNCVLPCFDGFTNLGCGAIILLYNPLNIFSKPPPPPQTPTFFTCNILSH